MAQFSSKCAVAADAQRLEVFEVMGAAENAVGAEAGLDMVDLYRPAAAAAHAGVFVPALRRPPRARPPVVLPKRR